MKKLLVIDNCNDCPHFDNSYWGYEEKCKKLKRKIPWIMRSERSVFPIPDDCPLPNAEEKT